LHKVSSSDNMIYWFFFQVMLSSLLLQLLCLFPRLLSLVFLTLSFLHDLFCNTLLMEDATIRVRLTLFIDQNFQVLKMGNCLTF